jgi:hypothetical protein
MMLSEMTRGRSRHSYGVATKEAPHALWSSNNHVSRNPAKVHGNMYATTRLQPLCLDSATANLAIKH